MGTRQRLSCARLAPRWGLRGTGRGRGAAGTPHRTARKKKKRRRKKRRRKKKRRKKKRRRGRGGSRAR